MKSGKKPREAQESLDLRPPETVNLRPGLHGQLVMLSFCSQGDWARVRGGGWGGGMGAARAPVRGSEVISGQSE